MRLCHDLAPVVRFLERHQPASLSLLNIISGRTGERPGWVRADNPADPGAVLARFRWLYCFSPDPDTGRRLLDRLPVRWQPRFHATPAWAWRHLCRHRQIDWETRCFMYALTDPRRLRGRSRHRVGPLTPADAALVAGHWPYGRSPDLILERIRHGTSAAVRRDGRPVAWALTHADGSMGFLHVLAEYRGQGMARSIGTWLARHQLAADTGAFVYIERKNRASLSLTESMGFERVGEYVWFGTQPRVRPRFRRPLSTPGAH